MRKLLFLFFPLLTLSSGIYGQAYTVEEVPNPKTAYGGYVSDPDKILSAEEAAELNRICQSIEDSTTAQVAVVLLQSIGEAVPKDFAVELFAAWGIGQAETDNGLLVLTVMDQRRTEFETGYGMEAVLPDVVCYRIGMQELVPYFREGQYGEGLRAALLRIQEVLEDPEAQADIRAEMERIVPRSVSRAVSLPVLIYGGLMVILALVVALWIIAQLVSKQDQHDKYMAIRKFHWLGWAIIFPVLFIPIFFLTRRLLRRLRDQARFSKINGQPMHKLGEAEDDELLEYGQVVEEQLGSVDYDVWVTQDRSDVLILPYQKRWSKYKPCPECQFRTYYQARTETLRKATTSSSGKGVRIHECKHCHYTKEVEYTIPRISSGSSGGGSGGGSFGGGGSSSFGGGSSGGGGSGVSW